MAPHTRPRLRRWVLALRRLRWPVLAAWLLVLAVAGVGALGLADRLSGGGWYAADSDSARAIEATRDGFLGRGDTTITLVIRDDRHTVDEPAFVTRATDAYEHVVSTPELAVDSAYGWGTTSGAASEPFVGDDDRTTVTTLGLDLPDGDARRELPHLQAELDRIYADQDLVVALVGPASVWGEINVLSEHGLLRAELLALPLLVVIMLAIYRGWIAAGLSLMVAVTSVVWTLGLLSVVTRYAELSVFVQNAATMLGLGVAVDYSLFLIARYREQRRAGQYSTAALTAALHTAGHTVLGSGLTVVLAMSTLFLIDLPVIRSLALGAVVVVSVAMVVNLIVLPAFLLVLGDRVLGDRPWPLRARRPRPVPRRALVEPADPAFVGVARPSWQSWARWVMRRPVVFLLLGLTVMGVLAAPAAQLATFTPDARIVPPGVSVRTGWDAIRDGFGDGAASPMNVVVESERPLTTLPADQERQILTDLVGDLDNLNHVASVTSATTVLDEAGVRKPLTALQPDNRDQLPAELADAVGHFLSADGRTLVVQVIPEGTAASPETLELLDRVRERVAEISVPGVRAVVGGETAEGVDGNAAIRDGLPLVAGTMLVVIYVLLLIIFRSIFLPLKAIALNVASVAATYGVVVLVFQHGLGADLLGFEPTGQVTNFVPVLLLTLLFSLSTDYEVYLLSRVREEWQKGYDNTTSVARGLELTAPLISGAAVLMITVFSAFALASVLPVQELGLGMAFAIAIDATLVRLVLVPASMRLMGRWNWWNPWSTTSRRRLGGNSVDHENSSPRRTSERVRVS
jgi:RND superfamily putative drug exporter